MLLLPSERHSSNQTATTTIDGRVGQTGRSGSSQLSSAQLRSAHRFNAIGHGLPLSVPRACGPCCFCPGSPSVPPGLSCSCPVKHQAPAPGMCRRKKNTLHLGTEGPSQHTLTRVSALCEHCLQRRWSLLSKYLTNWNNQSCTIFYLTEAKNT
ncbi:hypothetical protein LY78DRAFT_332592 [Colletotrichum sublineola]|nr:hypothetical protein LY78DRAFT_332592 [Colletotrichum sublineola]